ncbi:MAG: AtpZ/AtpI family protein [Planctomycetota bacterium]
MTNRKETSFGAYAGVGVSFIAETGLFAGAGWWCDGFFGTRPWLLVVGMFVGLIAATYHLLKLVDGIEAKAARAGDRDSAPTSESSEGPQRKL